MNTIMSTINTMNTISPMYTINTKWAQWHEYMHMHNEDIFIPRSLSWSYRLMYRLVIMPTVHDSHVSTELVVVIMPTVHDFCVFHFLLVVIIMLSTVSVFIISCWFCTHCALSMLLHWLHCADRVDMFIVCCHCQNMPLFLHVHLPLYYYMFAIKRVLQHRLVKHQASLIYSSLRPTALD